MMLINAALNSRTGLPVLGQHFMRVPRLALPYEHGSGRSDRNFKIRIFMVKGSVYYPVYDPITRLNLGPDYRQWEITAFDRKGARPWDQKQYQRNQDSASHRTQPSISSWLRATGFELRGKTAAKVNSQLVA